LRQTANQLYNIVELLIHKLVSQE